MGVPFIHVFDDGLALVPLEPFLRERTNLSGGKYYEYLNLPHPKDVEHKLAAERLMLGRYEDLRRFLPYLNVVKTFGVLAYAGDKNGYASVNRNGHEVTIRPELGEFSQDIFSAWAICGPERVKGMFGFLVVPASG